MSKKQSGRGFWALTPNGHTVHINGRRDMSQEMLDKILGIMDAAAKNAAEIMPCGHSKADTIISGKGVPFCGQCALDEAEAKK